MWPEASGNHQLAAWSTCGICGVPSPEAPESAEIVEAMARVVAHCGSRRLEPVAFLVVRHRRAAADLRAQIWALLMLEAWQRQEHRWKGGTTAERR